MDIVNQRMTPISLGNLPPVLRGILSYIHSTSIHHNHDKSRHISKQYVTAPSLISVSPQPILGIFVLHILRLPPFRLRPFASPLFRYIRASYTFLNCLVDDRKSDFEVDFGGIYQRVYGTGVR